MENKRVGEQIKSLRVQNNIKQSVLANKMDVTSSTVSHWETGRRMPSLEDLKRIAHLFDVSLSYFDIHSPVIEQSSSSARSSERNQNIHYLEHPVIKGRILGFGLLGSFSFALISVFIPNDFGIFTGILSVLIAVVVIERVLSIRYKTVNHGKHKTVSIPINHAVYYVHRYDEQEIEDARRHFRWLIHATLIFSLISYVMFANSVAILDNDYLAIVFALIALAAIVLSTNRYKHYLRGHLIQKNVEYYQSRRSFRYLTILWSFLVDLSLFYGLALIMFIYRFVFIESRYAYIILAVLTLNAGLSLYVYYKMQMFLANYELFEFDTKGARHKLK